MITVQKNSRPEAGGSLGESTSHSRELIDFHLKMGTYDMMAIIFLHPESERVRGREREGQGERER